MKNFRQLGAPRNKPIYRHVVIPYRGEDVAFGFTHGEYKAYCEAIERGYLRLRADAKGCAYEAYFAFCYGHDRPFIVVERRGRTYCIKGFLHSVECWLCEDLQQDIRDRFRTTPRVRGYVNDGEVRYSGIPANRVDELAEFVLATLIAAEGPWRRSGHGTGEKIAP